MASDRTRISLDLVEDPFISMRSNENDLDLEDLMRSMREIGLVEPIVVRRIGDRYEIIAGHRRTRAARLLNWVAIDAVIVEADDDKAFAMRLAENIARRDVDPVDQALFLGEIMTRYKKTATEMAAMLHHSEAWIKERLEVFEMPDYLQEILRQRHISLGAALWIAKIENDRTRRYYAFWAAQNGVSVAAAKRWHDDLASRNFEFEAGEKIVVDTNTGAQSIRAATKCHLCGRDVFLDEAQNVFIHKNCPVE